MVRLRITGRLPVFLFSKAQRRARGLSRIKGNGYVRAINIEPLSDDDFVFDV